MGVARWGGILWRPKNTSPATSLRKPVGKGWRQEIGLLPRGQRSGALPQLQAMSRIVFFLLGSFSFRPRGQGMRGKIKKCPPARALERRIAEMLLSYFRLPRSKLFYFIPACGEASRFPISQSAFLSVSTETSGGNGSEPPCRLSGPPFYFYIPHPPRARLARVRAVIKSQSSWERR